MKYRLIALDLDGTLFGADLRISPRSRAALAAARRAGMHVTLASGRAFRAMAPWVRELDIVAPVISYQGAVVTEPRSGRRQFERTLSLDLVEEAVDFARRRDLSLTVYADDTIYVEAKRHSDAYYERWFGLPWRVVPDLRRALPEPPIKFLLIGEPAELDAAQPDLARRLGRRVEVLRSHEEFLEGLAPGVTKGAALAWVAERLGVRREETVAFGDAGNDRAMIEWAGLGVAMGNGSDEVKAVADLVAPPVDEDGVAQVLEACCLDGRGL